MKTPNCLLQREYYILFENRKLRFEIIHLEVVIYIKNTYDINYEYINLYFNFVFLFQRIEKFA